MKVVTLLIAIFLVYAPLTGGNSPQLLFMVNVDGKAFFANIFTSRSWTGASDYCKGLGMRLASITSEAQFEALNTCRLPAFPTLTAYWTSGRDAQKGKQFEWNVTDGEVPSYLPFHKTGHAYQMCVLFNKSPQNNSYLSDDFCSNSWPFTLCETF